MSKMANEFLATFTAFDLDLIETSRQKLLKWCPKKYKNDFRENYSKQIKLETLFDLAYVFAISTCAWLPIYNVTTAPAQGVELRWDKVL